MTKKERVRKAIQFDNPDRIPVYHFNYNRPVGDILCYGLSLQKDGVNEWGFKWKTMNDGTMGQPEDPVIREWAQYPRYKVPELRAEERLSNLEAFMELVDGHYLLAGIGLTGFNKYTFIRGFENSMIDFLVEPQKSNDLFDRIIEFEKQMIVLAAENGFDGVHFADDWGTQNSLIISPAIWRDKFKPRYQSQFGLAHRLGLHVWFHSCGNIDAIIPDFHEIGVDVMNISQPNVVNIEHIGKQLKGKQCFMVPISYQTVSISGTREEILSEGQRLFNALGTERGGFIGYVEEYSSVGMTMENYQATIDAFESLTFSSSVSKQQSQI
ncbi:hypothetical protein JXJ21_03730 [candidate division KSB1 bacterium]|nr:hypothetical protein [candidate division KSB1 bacterium]